MATVRSSTNPRPKRRTPAPRQAVAAAKTRRPSAKAVTPSPASRTPSPRPAPAANPPPRTASKQAIMVSLLHRGTTIAALMDATGWQPHSVRGFLAGVIKKKLGLSLVSDNVHGERVYRIAAAASPFTADQPGVTRTKRARR